MCLCDTGRTSHRYDTISDAVSHVLPHTLPKTTKTHMRTALLVSHRTLSHADVLSQRRRYTRRLEYHPHPCLSRRSSPTEGRHVSTGRDVIWTTHPLPFWWAFLFLLRPSADRAQRALHSNPISFCFVGFALKATLPIATSPPPPRVLVGSFGTLLVCYYFQLPLVCLPTLSYVIAYGGGTR